MKHITDFLHNEEGWRTNAYIPQNEDGVIGISGVTIAAGVDLGQLSRDEFEDIPMSVESRESLERFVGLRGDAALEALESAGHVEISGYDARAISDYVFQQCIDAVHQKYASFSTLNPGAQTALVSLAYNMGLNGSPSTSGKIAERRYVEAVDELRDPDAWKNRELDGRRNREADEIEKFLS